MPSLLIDPNREPIFPGAGDWQWVENMTAANNTADLTSGTVYLVGVADTIVGSWLEEVLIKAQPANSTVATVCRLWINDGERAVTSITASTDVIADTAHGMENGDTIMFTVIGGGADGLDVGVELFIVNKNANDFQVSLTLGGAALDITTDGSGTSRYRHLRIRSGVWPSTIAVAARSCLIKEYTVQPTTASAAAAQADMAIGIGRAMKPGHRLYMVWGTAPGGSGKFCAAAVMGPYRPTS